MKTKLLTTALFFVTYLFCCSFLGQEIKDGQHYGQKLPGKTPEIYSPKFSFIKGEITSDIVLSPYGREACYIIEDTSSKERYDRNIIYYTQMENGKWKNPEIAYFVANQGKGSMPQFSPEGNTFTYSYNGDFWTSEKKSGKWSPAEKMPEPVNSDKYECGFSFAKGDRFYFASAGRPEGKSKQCDIYCAKKSNDTFGPALNLSNLNTERSECVLAVSPDEKYIIFTRYINKSGNDAVDLYISFRKKDGTWTVARELSSPFNSPGSNHSPRFSSDGKYFFYSQSIKTEANATKTTHFWVSATAFDEMMKSELAANGK
jgi:Tol biopolymer transport system component